MPCSRWSTHRLRMRCKELQPRRRLCTSPDPAGDEALDSPSTRYPMIFVPGPSLSQTVISGATGSDPTTSSHSEDVPMPDSQHAHDGGLPTPLRHVGRWLEWTSARCGQASWTRTLDFGPFLARWVLGHAGSPLRVTTPLVTESEIVVGGSRGNSRELPGIPRRGRHQASRSPLSTPREHRLNDTSSAWATPAVMVGRRLKPLGSSERESSNLSPGTLQ